jgi:hypothetical protein
LEAFVQELLESILLGPSTFPPGFHSHVLPSAGIGRLSDRRRILRRGAKALSFASILMQLLEVETFEKLFGYLLEKT